MSTALAFSNSKDLIDELEPILISLYRTENGKSPTLYELKQYLVSYASEKLVDILISSDSILLKSMSPKEALTAINIYIRKLRVW
ncbi:MAG: hypothetical protein ACRBDX_00205 [Gammaproteobacteria bacterium]